MLSTAATPESPFFRGSEFGSLNLLQRHGMHYARTGHVDRLRATYRRKGSIRHMDGAYDLERDTLIG